MNTKVDILRILCYGDSLTWGYKPNTNHERFPANIRWTGQLQSLLGNKYEILEEGLNSRTLNSEDPRPGKKGRNGAESLKEILRAYKPIDNLILMLGTNELKDSFNRDMRDISNILEEKYIKIIRNKEFGKEGRVPSVLIISPPNIDLTKDYAFERFSQVGKKLEKMRDIFQEIAKKNDCAFLDSSTIVSPGTDGIHIDEDNHKKLGEAIYRKLKEIVNQ